MARPYFQHLANTIAMSGHADPAVITVDGVGYPVGATWARAEDDQALAGEHAIVVGSTIRIPATSVPREPRYPDAVTIEGRDLFVEKALLKGPVYLLWLTIRGPRAP